MKKKMMQCARHIITTRREREIIKSIINLSEMMVLFAGKDETVAVETLYFFYSHTYKSAIIAK